MKILCFDASEEVQKRFSEEFSDIIFFEKSVQDLQSDDFMKYQDVEIITSFISSIFTAEILEKFPHLKMIATRSSGLDHIDLDYCQQHNIEVKNVPEYGTQTVAEHVFALLLALSKKVFYSYERVKKENGFSRLGLEKIRGFDLAGKTLGVVGTGKIGRAVIKIAKGFQMEVVAQDIHPDASFAQQENFIYVDFDTLLEKSDIISINIPLCKDTFHLFSTPQFKRMKKGVIIINTARGEIIDTRAFYQALKEEKVILAGLDVLEKEQCLGREVGLDEEFCEDEEIKKINRDLIGLPQVIVTPHNAFNTQEALERIYKKTIKNIKEFKK